MLPLLLSESRTLSKSTRSLEDPETKNSVAALDASCIKTPNVKAFACSSLEIVLRSKQSVAGPKTCCGDAAELNRTALLETAAAAFSTLLVAMIFTQEKCSKESEAHLKQTHSRAAAAAAAQSSYTKRSSFQTEPNVLRSRKRAVAAVHK
jgi:hypothetical protein